MCCKDKKEENKQIYNENKIAYKAIKYSNIKDNTDIKQNFDYNLNCIRIKKIIEEYIITKNPFLKIKFFLETNAEDLINRLPELRMLFNSNEETELFLNIVNFRKEFINYIQKGFYKDFKIFEIGFKNG